MFLKIDIYGDSVVRTIATEIHQRFCRYLRHSRFCFPTSTTTVNTGKYNESMIILTYSYAFHLYTIMFNFSCFFRSSLLPFGYTV